MGFLQGPHDGTLQQRGFEEREPYFHFPSTYVTGTEHVNRLTATPLYEVVYKDRS